MPEMDAEKIDAITASILTSSKYKHVYPPTVQKAVEDAARIYPAKRVEKEARKRLHRVWGAFLDNPNFGKAVKKLEDAVTTGADTKDALLESLTLQTSTKERIPLLDDFYERIFDVTGIPARVVEYGCGLNPLTAPWMGEGISYLGFDIDGRMVEFVNKAAEITGIENIRAKPGDFLIDLPVHADVSFLLKVVPLLEHQTDHSLSLLLEAVPSKFTVVSFPIRSISGRHKGMKEFYTETFPKHIPGSWRSTMLEFDSEIVFVLGQP